MNPKWKFHDYSFRDFSIGKKTKVGKGINKIKTFFSWRLSFNDPHYWVMSYEHIQNLIILVSKGQLLVCGTLRLILSPYLSSKTKINEKRNILSPPKPIYSYSDTRDSLVSLQEWLYNKATMDGFFMLVPHLYQPARKYLSTKQKQHARAYL